MRRAACRRTQAARNGKGEAPGLLKAGFAVSGQPFELDGLEAECEHSMDAPAAAGAALSEQSEAAAGATADTDGGICPAVWGHGQALEETNGAAAAFRV